MSPSSPPTIVSIGYEQRTLDELIGLLLDHDVDVLVDVRLNAISHKRGFSKSALAQALRDEGIEYRHERLLGNPKENRDDFRRGLESARRLYSDRLDGEGASAYQEVIDLIGTSRPALMCVEREQAGCHRHHILERAERDVPGLRVIDL